MAERLKDLEGKKVVATTYPSLEYDTAPQQVTGVLRLNWVAPLEYTQSIVAGRVVDPETVKEAE